jgi:AbrB family looped-hinge helix DNA binding protein
MASLCHNTIVVEIQGAHRTSARLDRQGRILIPAELRKELAMRPGEVLTLLVEDGELRIRSVSAGVRKAQAIAAKYIKPEPGRSLVDEFIAERRREAARE